MGYYTSASSVSYENGPGKRDVSRVSFAYILLIEYSQAGRDLTIIMSEISSPLHMMGTISNLTLFQTTYLPGMWIWRAVC